MNVLILKTLLIASVLLLFSGCAQKQIVYVDRPVEVKIPVKCIIPITHCDFNKETDTEVITSLRTCVEDFRKNSEVCQ